jgi:nitrate reductase NapAB chaperone NapD
MLLKSYLVYPRPGGREPLLEALSLIPECEVIPASNQDLFILVTATSSAEEDQRLEESIAGLAGFGNMALVSGYCGGLSEETYA